MKWVKILGCQHCFWDTRDKRSGKSSRRCERYCCNPCQHFFENCFACGAYWPKCLSTKRLRKDCRKCCSLGTHGDNADPELDAFTMCCCIPLRTGILAWALFTTLLGFLVIVSRLNGARFWEAEARRWTGGYTLVAQVVVEFVESLGFIFGLIGIRGVLQLRAKSITDYYRYMVVRVLAAFVMYFFDLPALYQCEEYYLHPETAIASYGFNPHVTAVAVSRTCDEERVVFLTCSLFYMMLCVYLTQKLKVMILDLEDEPMQYLLKMRKGLASNAFYAHSTGVRSQHALYTEPDQLALETPFPCLVGPPTTVPGSSQFLPPLGSGALPNMTSQGPTIPPSMPLGAFGPPRTMPPSGPFSSAPMSSFLPPPTMPPGGRPAMGPRPPMSSFLPPPTMPPGGGPCLGPSSPMSSYLPPPTMPPGGGPCLGPRSPMSSYLPPPTMPPGGGPCLGPRSPMSSYLPPPTMPF